MAKRILKRGDVVKLEGVSMNCLVVGVKDRTEFGIVELRRIHPDSTEIEGGDPLRMPIDSLNFEYVDDAPSS